MQGYKRHNEPGGIYIIAARCEYFEAATDMIKIKIGLAYKGQQGTMERALEHKTSCPDNLELMNAFAVDDMTSIPMPEDTIGGVHEMERYLHALMSPPTAPFVLVTITLVTPDPAELCP